MHHVKAVRLWEENVGDSGRAPTDEELLTFARAVEVQAFRDAADERGVNVGDEDSEWWSGYRQAQREVIRWLSDRADRIERGEES